MLDTLDSYVMTSHSTLAHQTLASTLEDVALVMAQHLDALALQVLVKHLSNLEL